MIIFLFLIMYSVMLLWSSIDYLLISAFLFILYSLWIIDGYVRERDKILKEIKEILDNMKDKQNAEIKETVFLIEAKQNKKL